MSLWNRVRGYLTVGGFGATCLGVSWPLLRAQQMSMHIAGRDPRAYRQEMTDALYRWGNRYWEYCRLALGITLEINEPTAPLRRPAIVIANHRSALDHVLMVRVAKTHGVTGMRWVLKEGMRKAPVLGWLCTQAECVFVRRCGDPRDIDDLRRFARLAKEDGRSVLIYPEGTRFTGIPKSESLYTHVRYPRSRGFAELCRMLPDHDILSVTIDWNGRNVGRTIFDGERLVGTRISARVERYPNPGFEDAATFLMENWAKKECLLGGGSRLTQEE